MSFIVSVQQITIMFILISLGWIAFRVQWIGPESVKGLTNLLIYMVSPAVIIRSFQRPFDLDQARAIGLSFLVSLTAFALTTVISRLLFTPRRFGDRGKLVALRYGTVYSNAGFIGIPLTYALLGNDGVIHAVAYVAAFTVFNWTFGVALFERDHRSIGARARRAIVNPGIIAIFIALALFVCSIELPALVSDSLGYLASMNTALSMIVVGLNLAAFSLRTVFNDRLVWLGTVVRNIAIPLLFLALLPFVPMDSTARLAILIGVSTPVGAMLVIFSARYEFSTVFATKILCLSTLASVITLPAALALAALLW